MKETELTVSELEMVLGCREKNHIDNECFIELSPDMRKMFSDNNEKQLLSVFREPENICFEEVSKRKSPKRLLTQEEYDAFPEECKSTKGLFKKAFLDSSLFLIAGIVALYFSIGTIATSEDLTKSGSAFLFFALGFAFLGIFSITFTSSRDHDEIRQIRKNSEAVFGRVLFFRKKAAQSDVYGSTDEYLIDVAFYDDECFVRNISVPKAAWDDLERDDEVCLHNGRLAMYRRDGKLIYVSD